MKVVWNTCEKKLRGKKSGMKTAAESSVAELQKLLNVREI